MTDLETLNRHPLNQKAYDLLKQDLSLEGALYGGRLWAVWAVNRLALNPPGEYQDYPMTEVVNILAQSTPESQMKLLLGQGMAGLEPWEEYLAPQQWESAGTWQELAEVLLDESLALLVEPIW